MKASTGRLRSIGFPFSGFKYIKSSSVRVCVAVPSKMQRFLRQVRTTRKKVDLSKCHWNPQRKIGLATHFFEIINLESQQKW